MHIIMIMNRPCNNESMTNTVSVMTDEHNPEHDQVGDLVGDVVSGLQH